MIDFRDVRGILFDSGDTLVRPVGGEWLPGSVFRRLLAEAGHGDLATEALARGHATGLARLLSDHRLTTEAKEIERYTDYCACVLDALAVDETATLTAREIARRMVLDVAIEPFADALPALQRFRSLGLVLGVISNGWPSLDRQLREVGLRHFFDLLVISAEVGSRKPDERIFAVALERLGLEAGTVLLVDDAPENVVTARALGMQGVMVARNGVPPAGDLPWVSSLAEIEVYPSSPERPS